MIQFKVKQESKYDVDDGSSLSFFEKQMLTQQFKNYLLTEKKYFKVELNKYMRFNMGTMYKWITNDD